MHKAETSKAPFSAPAYVLEAYAERKAAIKSRLNDFRIVPQEEWFYELCFCICTPQSKALHAEQVVNKLKQLNFLHASDEVDPTSILRDPEHYIRFHNVKAQNLRLLRTGYPQVEEWCLSAEEVGAIRERLVSGIRGIGMKEASHFLRNIGHRGIAIIDRHILKHLHRCGVVDSAKPPSSKRAYEEIEAQWKQFASDIRIDMDELDLVFWSLETGVIIK